MNTFGNANLKLSLQLAVCILILLPHLMQKALPVCANFADQLAQTV